MDMSLSKLRELVMDREAGRACDSWGRKESDMIEWLNWTEPNHIRLMCEFKEALHVIHLNSI